MTDHDAARLRRLERIAKAAAAFVIEQRRLERRDLFAAAAFDLLAVALEDAGR